MFVIPKDLRTARLALTAWPHRSKLRAFLPVYSLNVHAHSQLEVAAAFAAAATPAAVAAVGVAVAVAVAGAVTHVSGASELRLIPGLHPFDSRSSKLGER